MNVDPASYTTEEQLAYAIKQLRKARKALVTATRGMPTALAAEVIRLAYKSGDSGQCCTHVRGAADILRTARDTFRVAGAQRHELTEGRAKPAKRAVLAVEARRKYL